jgi:hypothetical protein
MEFYQELYQELYRKKRTQTTQQPNKNQKISKRKKTPNVRLYEKKHIKMKEEREEKEIIRTGDSSDPHVTLHTPNCKIVVGFNMIEHGSRD